MQFTNAVDSRNNVSMTVDEIVNAHDFNELQNNLQCPTEGCQAKLKFINGKTGAYLRTFPRSMHDEKCPYANRKKVNGYRSSRTLFAGLSEEQSATRISRMLKEAFPTKRSESRKTKNSRRTRRTVNKGETSSDSVSVKYSSSAKPELTRGKHTPHIYRLLPNQIGPASDGTTFRDFGFIKSFEKVSDADANVPHYKVVIQDTTNKETLTLLMRNNYFRRFPAKTLDNGMTDFIMTYSKKHAIIIGFIAKVVDGTNRIAEINNDYDVKVFSNIVNNNAKSYTFTEFYAIVSHQL